MNPEKFGNHWIKRRKPIGKLFRAQSLIPSADSDGVLYLDLMTKQKKKKKTAMQKT